MACCALWVSPGATPLMLAMLPTLMAVAVTPVAVAPPLPAAGVWFPLAPQAAADVAAAELDPPEVDGEVVAVVSVLPEAPGAPLAMPPEEVVVLRVVVVVALAPEPAAMLLGFWLELAESGTLGE